MSRHRRPSHLGTVTMPPLGGALAVLWETVLDLAERLPPAAWQLVGGQMVMLHALAAGRAPARASVDVDVLADLVAESANLRACVAVVQSLGYAPLPSLGGTTLHRFVRDDAVVDVLAPDHTPPSCATTTGPGQSTILIDGGYQALRRGGLIEVRLGDRQAPVPVPDLLGALVLKSAAWAADSRDRERHSGDAALLCSLITDPLQVRTSFAGSDGRRLRALDRALGDPDAAEWAALGDHADDGYATWRLLLAGAA